MKNVKAIVALPCDNNRLRLQLDEIYAVHQNRLKLYDRIHNRTVLPHWHIASPEQFYLCSQTLKKI